MPVAIQFLYSKMGDFDLLLRPQAFYTKKLWEKLEHRAHSFKLYNMMQNFMRFHSVFGLFIHLICSQGLMKIFNSGLHRIV